jgi:hypothetical protein
MEREDTQDTYTLTHGLITAGNTASLELQNTNVDYQTSKAARIVLTIQGNATTLTDFEIREHTVFDNSGGNLLEDFPSVSLAANNLITSKVLDVPAGSYINVKVNTGTITSVEALLVE